MIRWSEQHDTYRLDVSKREVVAGAILCAIGVVASLLVTQVPRLGPMVHMPGKAGDFACSVSLLGCVSVPVVCVVLIHLKRRAWVEVPIRDGPIRWWYPGLDDPIEAVGVQSFSLQAWAPGVYSVSAILATGERCHLLGAWVDHSEERVTKVVEELNERLRESRSNSGPPAEPSGA